MPYSPMKKSSCIKMYDSKGKPAGLMAEGSMAHMEYISQEKSNLTQDMPIDNRGIGQMSPYKMDHGSPAKETDTDPKKKVEKKEENTSTDKDKYINKKLDELQKNRSDMSPQEMLKYAQNSYAMLPTSNKK